MTNLRNFIGLFFISLLFFTACKKDTITPTTPNNNTPESPTVNTPANTISAATQTRALAAAASVATSRNNPDTLTNDCGCYDVFDGVDFDASHEEVEAAIDAILENLTEEEITRLFEPVCTDDGQIYESACIADCEGVTGYHICSDEELDDYFFGDFECTDLDSLTFPTEIELPDGTTVTVNSEEELFELFEKWFEALEEEWGDEDGEWGDHDGEWEDEYEDDFEDCFTLVFPISVQFPGGDIIIYDSEEALYTGIDAWYDMNAESEDDPALVYPFDVLLPDSSTVTISSEMDEEAIWETCFGDLDFDICFELNYPITLVYPDGSTLEINSDDELEKAADEYYEANPDTETDIDVQYPVNITLSDGTVQAINDEADLDAAFEACFGDYDEDDMGRISQKSMRSALSAKRVVKGAFLSGSAAN